MIKFKTTGKRPLVGLGLSDGNLEKLREEKPIHINGEELGLDGVDILIFWGKTEKAIQKELIKLGLITNKTRIQEGYVRQ